MPIFPEAENRALEKVGGSYPLIFPWTR